MLVMRRLSALSDLTSLSRGAGIDAGVLGLEGRGAFLEDLGLIGDAGYRLADFGAVGLDDACLLIVFGLGDAPATERRLQGAELPPILIDDGVRIASSAALASTFLRRTSAVMASSASREFPASIWRAAT